MTTFVVKSKENQAGIIKDEQGRFVKGVSGNPKGRTKLTEAQKIKRRAMKSMVEKYIGEYEKDLAEALPEISPALIREAKKGNIPAIKEVHEVLGAHKNKGGNTIVPIQINFGEDRNKYA